MLSNSDIIKELGRNIEIHPFFADNLRGASINLTTSNMAWIVSDKKSAVNSSNDTIIIKKHDATLILTKEVFAVTNKIGGTFHMRVAEASLGLGHISTVINPGWCGRPLIAVTNPTDKDIFIKVNDPFVIMVLEYLNTPSTIEADSRRSSRYDVLHDYELTISEKEVIFNSREDDRDVIHSKAKNEKSYNKIKRTERKKITVFTILQIVIALVAIAAIIWITCTNMTQWITIPSIVLTVIVTNAGRLLFDKLNKSGG